MSFTCLPDLYAKQWVCHLDGVVQHCSISIANASICGRNWGCYPVTLSCFSAVYTCPINTSRPRQNGRHFVDDIFKYIFWKQNVRISIKISLKFVPKSPIDNIPALVRIMACHRPDDEPLSEPMKVRSVMHICITWPQWMKLSRPRNTFCIIGLLRVNPPVTGGFSSQRASNMKL